MCAPLALSIHFIANLKDEDMKTSKLLPASTAALRVMALAVLLAIGATAAQSASAQPPGVQGNEHRGGHGGSDMGYGGGMGHGMGHGMGISMGSPRTMDRLLDAVDASVDQRVQIKQITDAARADMKAQHGTGRQLREDSAALFAQPTVDARAAEALRQQMLARYDQASKRQLQMMLDVSRVLTPEQRKVLADKFAQRRSVMARYRAERSAAEPKPAR